MVIVNQLLYVLSCLRCLDVRPAESCGDVHRSPAAKVFFFFFFFNYSLLLGFYE